MMNKCWQLEEDYDPSMGTCTGPKKGEQCPACGNLWWEYHYQWSTPNLVTELEHSKPES